MKKNASKLFKLILIQLLIFSGLVSAQTESSEKLLKFDDTTKAGVSGTYTFVSGKNNEPLLKADRLSKEMLSSNVTWSNFSTGVSDLVRAVGVSNGGDIYIGGTFMGAGGNFISKWNGSNWTALGTSVSDPVKAIAISGTNVYVGGNFTFAGGNPANYIAKWNGSSWSALGSGVGGIVNAIAISGTNVYVGGGVYKCRR